MNENPNLLDGFATDDNAPLAEIPALLSSMGWTQTNPLVNGMHLNTLFKEVYAYLNFLQSKGLSFWSDDKPYYATDNNIDIVRRNNIIYFSKQNSNTDPVNNPAPKAPESNPDYWGILLDLDRPIFTELEKTFPTASIMAFPLTSVPNGFLECNGAEISRSAYPELFAKIGTLYGAGDGATTFKIPDLRGEFIRGLDNGKGVDSGRTIGSLQLDGIAEHYHDLNFNTRASGATTDGIGAIASASVPLGRNTVDKDTYHRTLYGSENYQNLATATPDTRPRNIAMLFCIKY